MLYIQTISWLINALNVLEMCLIKLVLNEYLDKFDLETLPCVINNALNYYLDKSGFVYKAVVLSWIFIHSVDKCVTWKYRTNNEDLCRKYCFYILVCSDAKNKENGNE